MAITIVTLDYNLKIRYKWIFIGQESRQVLLTKLSYNKELLLLFTNLYLRLLSLPAITRCSLI